MERLYSSSFYDRSGYGYPYVDAGFSAIRATEGPPANLQNFIGYKQADWRGKKRMEQMVAMGLPYNTDPQRVRLEPALTSAMGGRPIFSTSMPQPWGTWGPLSAGDVSDTGPFKDSTYREQEKRKAKIQNIINAPEPSQKETPEGYVRNRYGYLEPKEWYTEEGKKMTEEEYKKSKTTGKKESQLSTNTNMPQFDLYSSYSPLLQSPSLNFPYL